MVFLPCSPRVYWFISYYFVASAGELPLRNLLVEVRQVQVAHDAAGDRDLHDTVLSQQQVLVLNGHSGQVALRTTVPMRLMAVAFRNGRPTLVPGVVLLDATTGLVVAPRWDGTEFVELDLAASQAGSSRTPGKAPLRRRRSGALGRLDPRGRVRPGPIEPAQQRAGQ